MAFRDDFDEAAWVGFGCLFLLCWQSIARADGRVDVEEEAIRDRLVSGGEVHHVLPIELHNRFGSTRDLASEILTFADDDRRAFLSFVASTPETRKLAEAALRTDIALPEWVAQADTDDEQRRRSANGVGLRMEAFSFAVRTARASGARFGPKISEDEKRVLGELVRVVEVTPDQVGAIIMATGGLS